MANVFTIPAAAPFAQAIADALIAQHKPQDDPLALSRVRIFVPTRRAVRSLGEIFARGCGGAALLPDIRPLGDVDEDEHLFDGAAAALDILPAISTVRRRLLLAALITRWQQARSGEAMGIAAAARLAQSLGSFLDEVQTQGADLSRLGELADGALADYWAEVRDFLALLADQWPGLRDAEGRQDHVVHRDGALRLLAKRLENSPPDEPVIAAGSTGSIPATAQLLGVIARLPKGAVILPGLDLSLEEKSWAELNEGHPQFGMKQLLLRMKVERHDVKIWGGLSGEPSPREIVLRETLRPAPTTDAWRALVDEGADGIIKTGLEGLSLIEAADAAQEASAIGLMLREVLESPAKTAALVTPDRNLARRVAAEMNRWGISIDDSAGHPLARTAPGAFLCLVAEAMRQNFAPVAFLALLKHPLASGGRETAWFRRNVRQLDRRLRGPRPDAGLEGIARAIAQTHFPDDERKIRFLKWFSGLAKMFGAPLPREAQLAQILAQHVAVAEALAATDVENGGERIWQGDAGQKAQDLITALNEATAGEALPPIDSASYAAFFRMLAEEKAVRPLYGQHPRLAILGPLEARLQRYDLVILGGLNEGTWPQDAPVDPWLSRPMRRELGLEQPERAIGLSAHDFATLAAGPRVVLTRARKVEGAPAVASRWVQRLIQLVRGLGLEHQLMAAPTMCEFASLLARPDKVEPMRRPEPRPPVTARPRRLSVTEIETWLRDPYAIYAKHVLKLRALDPLDAEIGVLERGTAIHEALEKFVLAFPDGPPVDGEIQLLDIADQVFKEHNIPKAALALWRPRFIRAANWFVGVERGRWHDIERAHAEKKGVMRFDAPGGAFELYGIADRIDELRFGNGAVLDYKTGAPPSEKQVIQILSPQLPLEAAMLAEGGFADVGTLTPTELIYVRFAGGAKPGEVRAIKADAHELAVKAKALLMARVAQFDDEAQAYLPRVMPFRAEFAGDFDHLARVKEWSAATWGEDE